ncbi:MAG: glycosyltransferase family 39 protein [Nitrospinae bacterium]|nr:glycosyltransferase family 39 protein [Nitrospinota bacterium]
MERIAPLMVMALAAALRLGHFAGSGHNPLLHYHTLDEGYYLGLARAVVSGYLLGEPRVFFMDPLYGYLLAGLFALFGDDLLAVRLFQIALDTASVGFIYSLGARLAGPMAGLAGACLYAIHGPAIFYTLLALKTTATVFTALLFTRVALWAGAREGAWPWAAAGVLGGFAMLLSANMLLFAPLGWLAYLHAERPALRRALIAAAGAAAGLALVTGISAARNYYVSGQPAPLNTQSGRLLYASNNPENLTGRYNVPSFSRRTPVDSETDFHAEAERRLGRKLSPMEASAYWRNETAAFLMSDPGAAATLLWRKVLGTAGNYELPDNYSVSQGLAFSAVGRAPLPGFWLALALGAPGLVIGIWRNRRAAYLLIPVLTVMATVIIFYTSSRFRMPMVPLLCVGAGIFAAAAVDWLRARNWRPLPAWGAAALALAAVSLSAPAPPYSADEDYQLGMAYWTVGAFTQARSVADKGARDYPGDERFAVITGLAAMAESKWDEAHARFEALARRDPGNADAWHNLGLAALALGKTREAIAPLERAWRLNPRPRTLLALGRAHEQAGDASRAGEYYRRYLEMAGPGAPRANEAREGLERVGTK